MISKISNILVMDDTYSSTLLLTAQILVVLWLTQSSYPCGWFMVWRARNSGSLGCGVSVVTVTFIQIWRGNMARTLWSPASFAARNNPMLRHSLGPTGGRQSRTKWPALASSAARTASAARNSSILAGLVHSGTLVTISVSNSMISNSHAGL